MCRQSLSLPILARIPRLISFHLSPYSYLTAGGRPLRMSDAGLTRSQYSHTTAPHSGDEGRVGGGRGELCRMETSRECHPSRPEQLLSDAKIHVNTKTGIFVLCEAGGGIYLFYES